MDLITQEVPLQYGLAPWSVTAKTVVLRQATLQDVYVAVAAVEMPDDMAGAGRIAYQMAIDDAQILAQVDRIDGNEPPEVRLLAQLIHPDDMSSLRAAAEVIKKKQRGESEPSPTPEPSK
jgi:hypothetical protein